MCCTIGQIPAILTSTKLYAGEAMLDGKYVHVLAYQNNAHSNGPNAMIIPFPTSKPMGPENTLDTSKYTSFMDNICEATKHRTRSMKGFSRSDDFDELTLDCDIAQVFDVGDYTVILADNVAQVPEALKRVDIKKRPEVSTKFLIGYGKMYPNQPVALCCWNGEVKADPLLWWYEPTDPKNLFIPTMDAHDGNPPDINAMVDTDHIISVGSNLVPTGGTVHYQDFLYEGAPLLPTKVHGIRYYGMVKNGDMFASIDSMHKRAWDGAMIKRGASAKNFHLESGMNGWH